MFDVGFSEIALLLIIGLLVLGPERLPRVARTLGLYVRKARQSWYAVKADIDRELAAEEVKKTLLDPASLQQPMQELEALKEELSKPVDAPAGNKPSDPPA